MVAEIRQADLELGSALHETTFKEDRVAHCPNAEERRWGQYWPEVGLWRCYSCYEIFWVKSFEQCRQNSQ